MNLIYFIPNVHRGKVNFIEPDPAYSSFLFTGNPISDTIKDIPS